MEAIAFPIETNAVEIAHLIDHTLLKPDATPQQIRQLCQECLNYKFASACVNPVYVKLAADILQGSDSKVCTVIGFPLGATITEAKAFETEQVTWQGADEVDMVINIGALKAGDDATVYDDIAAVVKAAFAGDACCKVIIETALLTEEEKMRACQLAKEAGADFVKTSTGFSQSGATEADIRLMRRVVGTEMGIKAAGGIKTLADVERLLAAGATRIGASAGVSIIKETQN